MWCCGVPTAWRGPGGARLSGGGGPRGGGPVAHGGGAGRRGGGRDQAVPAATGERVVELAMSPPPAGRSRWTTRLLAKEVGLTSGCVSDLLRRHGLKPHRVRTYKVSRDPDFVAKV